MAAKLKLPKVTRYVANVGKSLAFATIDAVSENTSGIKDFIETNNDIFRESYAGAKNYRQTARNAAKSIKQSNLYQAISVGAKNLAEDLKTGNLYNDRDYSDQVLGLDEGFGDDDLDFSWDSDSVDYGTKATIASTNAMSNRLDQSIGAAAMSTNSTVAKGVRLVTESNKASTQLMMAQMDRSASIISSSMGSVYTAVDSVNKFLNGPLVSHMENSRKYYEASLRSLEETQGMMKEILEMQRNLYKAQQEAAKPSKLDQSFTASGGIDIAGYFKNIKGNIGNLMSEYGIGGFDLGGGNPFMAFAAAPMKIFTSFMIDNIMSKDFKKSLKSFDKGITSMFSQFVARMNSKKNDVSGGLWDIVASIFGIDIAKKDKIDPSKYKKDAVPFDGITRQAIIETIPGYLARIEAALTGNDERYYDYQGGTWKGARRIAKEYDDRETSTIANANSSIKSDIQPLIDQLKAINEGQARAMSKSVDRMIMQIYQDGGDFRPNDPNAWKHYGFKSKKEFDMAYSRMSRDTVRGIAGSNMRARQQVTNNRLAEEANGGIGRQLFNGAFDTDPSGKGKRVDYTGMAKGSGWLSLSKDEHGNNVFHYLREILNAITTKHGKNRNKNRGYANTRTPSSHKEGGSRRSSSEGSDDSGGDPDPASDDEDGPISDDIWERLEADEAAKAAGSAKKKGLGDWIRGKFGSSPMGKLFSKVFGGAADIVSKPLNYITKLIDKADESMFKMMFGNLDLKDKDGNKVESVFQYIAMKVKDTFADIGNWFKEQFKNVKNTIVDFFKEKAKPLWEKFGKPVKDQMFGMVKKGFGYAKGAAYRTLGGSIVDNKTIKSGNEGFAQEISALGLDSYEEILHSAETIGIGQTAAKYISIFKNSDPEIATQLIAISQKYGGKQKSAKKRQKKFGNISKTIKKVAQGDVVGTDEVINEANGNNNVGTNARGGFITKRGLTMVSPGEMIIPASFDPRDQQAMEALERRDRRRIINAIGLNAKGTVNTDQMKKNLRKIVEENKGKGAKTAASGILGGAAGLLAGVNPLLGALAGAGISIIEGSDTLKAKLFGTEMEDGTYKKGLLPKGVVDMFKKSGKDMTDLGITGGLLGLVTPLGPLGGAVIGASVGFLKNNEKFKEFVFGDKDGKGGFLNKESFDKFKKHIKKAAPSMLVGAGAGILMGPFGLLGNAIMGAGVGLLSSTSAFHKFVFGDPDDPKKGSLVGAMKKGILEPAKEKIGEILESFKGYAKKHLLEPLKNFWEPFKQGLKNMITSIGDGVKDAFNNVAEKYLGIPIHDFLQEKVFKPMTKLFFNILKFPLKVAKVAVAAPFKALGAVGNSMRMGQINKGKARDMSAADRLKFRQDHGVRNYFSRVRGADKTMKQDTALAGASLEELEALSRRAGDTLEGRQQASQSVITARTALGREISAFFQETNPDGTLRYDITKFKNVKKIATLAEEGDLDGLQKAINSENLTDAEKQDLYNRLEEKIKTAEAANEELAAANKNVRSEAKFFGKSLGRKVKDKKGIRDVKRSIDAEIAIRRKNAKAEEAKKVADAKAAKEADETFKKEHPAEAAILDATKQQTDIVSQQFQTANSKIDEIIKLIKIQLDPTGEAAKTTPPGNADGQQQDAPQITDGKSGVPAPVESPKGPAASETQKIAKAAGEKAEKEEAQQDVIAAEAAGVEGPAKPTLVQRMLAKAKESKVGQAVTGFASKLLPKSDEDSKEAVEARQQAAAEEAEQDKNDGDTARTADATEAVAEALGAGKKSKKKDKESGGILGKIFGGIGSGIKGIFSFLTGGLGTTVGKVALAAGGLSLLGWGSEWLKTSIWPKLKSFLFGEKDSEGNVTKTGLLGGLGDKMQQIFLGTGGVVEKIGGFFTKIREWYEGKGGIAGILVNDVVPKIITGWGYAMDNIVTPLVAILIKNLPSMFLGLVKGVINGIKIAVLNKGIVRDKATTIESGSALTELQSSNKKNDALLNSLGGAKDSVKNAFATAKNSAAYTANKAATINYDSLFGVNDAEADETYDVNGNPLNKTQQDIMYDDGFLGGKQSTNQIAYDADGNSLIDQYDTWNTTDSLAGKAVKVAGRGFLHGLLGRSSPIVNAMKNVSTKGVGKGTLKVVTGGMGAATKGAGNIFGGANSLGKKIGSLFKTNPIYSADDIAKQFGTSTDDIISALGKKAKYSADDIAKAMGTSADEVAEFMTKKTTKTATKVAGEAAEAATKKTGFLSKIGSKIKGLFTKSGDDVAEGVAKKAAKTATKSVDDVAEAVAKNADEIPGIVAKITNFFSTIASNSKILGFIKKACKNAATDDSTIKKALSKIASKLGNCVKGLGKGISKLASKLGKILPVLNIALYVSDFLWGYNNADTILGVAKGDTEFVVHVGHKVLCGLLNLITNELTFGLVPTETIVDIIVEFLFPLFGLSADDLTAARERADDIMDAWNEAHPDDTYTNLEDFNNKDKWWFKAKKAVKGALGKAGTWIKDTAGKAWSGIKSGASTAWEWAKEKAGNVWEGVTSFFSNVGSTFGKLFDGFKDTFSAIGKGIGKVLSFAWKGDIKGAYGYNVEENKESPVTSKIANIILGIGKVFYTPVILITSLVGKIKDVFVKLFDAAKQVIPAVGKGMGDTLKEAWKGNFCSGQIQSTGNELLDKISNVILFVGKVVTLPIQFGAFAIGKVVGLVKKVIDTAKKIVPNIAEGTGQLFASAWKGEENNTELKSTGNDLLDKIQNVVFGVIKVVTFVPRTLTYAVGRVVDAVKSVINAAKVIVPNIATGTGNLFKDAWKGEDNNVELPSTGNDLLDKIQGGIFGVIKVMTFVPRTLTYAVGRVVDAVKSVINAAKVIIPNVAKGTGNLFVSAWKGEENNSELPSTGNDLLDKIQGGIFGVIKVMTFVPRTLTYAVGRVVDAVKTVIDAAKKIIPNVATGTGNLFVSAWKGEENNSELPTTGNDLLDKIQGGIFGVVKVMTFVPRTLTYAVGRVVDAVKSVIEGAKKIIPNIAAGTGNLFKDAWKGEDNDRSLSSTGTDLLDKIQNGIFGVVKVITFVPRTLTYAVGRVVDAVKTVIDGAKKIIPNITSGTGDLFVSAWKGEESDKDLPSTGVDLLDKIQAGIFGVVKVVMFVPRTLTYAVGRVVDTIKGFIDGAKLIFPAVGTAFGTMFTKAWNGEELPNKVESTGNSTCDTIATVIYNIGKVLMTPVTLVMQAIGKIKNAITGGIQKIKDGFTFDDIIGGIKDAATNLGNSIKNGIKGAIDGVKNAISSAWDWVTGIFSSNASDDAAKMRAHYGLGHKYQSGPELAMMPYGDSTIGKAGCGPVAATNAINRLRGAGSMSVRKAADYAEDKGLTIPGGGTDIGYFKSFLNSQGIDATNTTNRGAIMDALKNGQQVVMLGQDKTNKHGVTFGTTPHFVTAIGLDANGNIVVEDPDMPQSSLVYKKDKVLNSMMTSTIVGGKGHYGLGEGEEEEGRKTSLNSLMSSFGSLTSSLVKSMFGEDAYNAISGSTSEADFENPEIAAKLWKYLRSKGFSEHGAAGIMGNIYNSSKFKTANLEDSKEEDLGTDVGYTYMVDRGQKTREQFATDGSGYGMSMWHSADRKRKLYDATVKKGVSIGDLDAQMAFLVDNLKSERSSLYSALRGSTDHAAASDAYLKQYHMDDSTEELDYETPKGYAATIYDTYHGSAHNAEYKKNAGRARAALESYETEDARTSRIMTSAGRASAIPKTVDYATFLETIVTLLMNISDNSALLAKILEILSSKFNIDINAEDVNKAKTQGKARTERALADLVRNSGGDAGSLSKMLNTTDNEYILTAMAAIAKE